MNRSAPFLLIDIRQIEPNGKSKNFSYSFFHGKGAVKLKPNISRSKYLSICGYGALPHRPTKGLSERLRRPFGASPFGNLRAQILSFTLEISVLLA